MGGSQDAPLYKWFVFLCLRGFLAVREHMNDLIQLVERMLNSGLHCFKEGALANFRARFFPDKDEKGAAEAMSYKIADAYNKYSTNMYDLIQQLQQDIFYWSGRQNEEDD